MESLQKYLKINQAENAVSSQWHSLVQRFTDRYNAGVTDKKYLKKPTYFAMRLAPLKKANGIGWLEWFYEDCQKKEHFGKYFNWSTDPKNIKKDVHSFVK